MADFEELREKYGETIAKKKFKIWYDKKLGNLRAKVEFIQENGIDVEYKPIGADSINRLLYSFVGLKGMSLKQLVDAKQVILDELASLGYEFDYDRGQLVEKRFTMADRIKLAEMEKKSKVVTPAAESAVTPVVTPVTTPVVTPVSEEKATSITEEKPVFDSVDIYELAAELKKLNPGADIRVPVFGLSSIDAEHNIFSSVPGKDLVLPNGVFFDGEDIRCSTKTGLSTNVRVRDLEFAIANGVLLLPKDLDYSNNREVNKAIYEMHKEYYEKKIAEGKEETKTEEKKEEIKEETKEVVVKEDGAADVVVAEPPKEEKKETKVKEKKSRNIVKNLKTAGIVGLVALVGGVVVSGGLNRAIKNNSTNTDDNSKIDVQVADNEQYGTTYNEPGDEVIFVSYEDNGEAVVDYGETTNYGDTEYVTFYDLGSVIDTESMEGQIQAINDLCFNYQTTELQNLVIDSDKEAISTINNMRNNVLNGYCDAETYLNNVVNYIFESGTIFDGRVIKTFDSLTPYAQYIVLTSSQSILQLFTNYEHTTTQNNYNYSNLTTSFDYMVDETYRMLTNANSYRR